MRETCRKPPALIANSLHMMFVFCLGADEALLLLGSSGGFCDVGAPCRSGLTVVDRDADDRVRALSRDVL